jgi:hypothetical protein
MTDVFIMLLLLAIVLTAVSAFGFIIKLIIKKPKKRWGIATIVSFVLIWVFGVAAIATSCDGEYIEISRTEATCTTAGEVVYKCDKCGETKTETIEPTGHKLEEISRTEPTEDSEGKVVSRCDVCGEEVTETLDKLEPKTEEKVEKSETETTSEETTESVDTSVTYDEIYREFKRNELNAKDVYNNNRYQITAKINGMNTGGILNLTGGATLTMEYKVDNTVVFFLAEFEKDQEDALKQISVGDTITFTGICHDGTFSKCELE